MNQGYDNTLLVAGLVMVLAFCAGCIATLAVIYIDVQFYAAPKAPWEMVRGQN